MDLTTQRIGTLLAPLTNWERTRSDHPRFTLETMRALLCRLGDWAFRPAPRSVQVGGSKGKGTTSAFLGTLAASTGLRAGIYASPHVSSIRERIVIDGEPIDGGAMETAVERALRAAEGLFPSASAFEVLTAAAALAFREAELDLAVFEVGLGGRLDATTALDVDLSILTGVELEHTQILGDTVAAIAAEKAFVFRPGRLGISGCHGDAAEVVRAHAAKVGCTLFERGRDFELIEGEFADDGSRHVRLVDAGVGATPNDLQLRDGPAVHLPALALAWAGMRHLFPGFRAPPVLWPPRLPGRFERRTDVDGRTILFDGAHTEESAARLAEELARRWPGQAFAVLFATALGKRWQSVLSRIAPLADHVLVTELNDTPSEDPATIVDWLCARGTRARAVLGARAGLSALREQDHPRLVTGSFHLVGELRDEVP